MTAPAAMASSRPITFAIPTNATPSVPTVVQELPVTIPTRAQTTAAVEVEPGRADQPDAVVDDGGDGPGHVPGADQRADGEQDEDRPDRGRDAADRGVRDPGDRVAVLERHQAGERGAQEQRHLERAVGGVDPEQADGEREQRDQHDDRQQRVEHRRRSRTPSTVDAVPPAMSSDIDAASALEPLRDSEARAHLRRRRGGAPSPRANSEQAEDDRASSTSTSSQRGSSAVIVGHLTPGPASAGRSCSARRRGPCRARSPRS